MTTPRDPLPVTLPPKVQAMLAELRDRRLKALVRVRRRGCGCLLGAVYRTPSGLLFLGERRALVHKTTTRKDARQQAVAIDLDEPSADVLAYEVGCEHGAPPLNVPELRETVEEVMRGVARPGSVHLL